MIWFNFHTFTQTDTRDTDIRKEGSWIWHFFFMQHPIFIIVPSTVRHFCLQHQYEAVLFSCILLKWSFCWYFLAKCVFWTGYWEHITHGLSKYCILMISDKYAAIRELPPLWVYKRDLGPIVQIKQCLDLVVCNVATVKTQNINKLLCGSWQKPDSAQYHAAWNLSLCVSVEQILCSI